MKVWPWEKYSLRPPEGLGLSDTLERPSIHFPTLELRVADSCTRLEDTLAIAALFHCLVRLLVRRHTINRDLTTVSRRLRQRTCGGRSATAPRRA